MGRISGKSFDRNRLSKKYPFVKAEKRATFVGDKNLIMEMGTIKFANETEKDFFFEIPFIDDLYNIMLVVRDTGTGESAHVNVYVDNTHSNDKKIRVVASAAFTGQVDIVAVKVG